MTMFKQLLNFTLDFRQLTLLYWVRTITKIYTYKLLKRGIYLKIDIHKLEIFHTFSKDYHAKRFVYIFLSSFGLVNNCYNS